MVLLQNEGSLNGGTIIGGGDTQSLLIVQKRFEHYALSGSEDAKTSGTSPCAHAQRTTWGNFHYLIFY